MILITLDFWGILLLMFLAGLVLVSLRFIWWLASVTEQLLSWLTKAGSRRFVKAMLLVLIGYDEQTYQKSRFILWNQARVRFAFLWTALLVAAGGLLLLHQVHIVGSVAFSWLLLVSAFIGLRCLMYWGKPKTPRISTQDPFLQSLIQDVNEQKPPVDQRPIIRRYDYLDELFWAST